MGETISLIKIYGKFGSVEIDALVDTGATFTKIPKNIAEKIGLKSEYSTEVELSDGRFVERKLALAEVEIEGIKRPVIIAISEDRERRAGKPAPTRRGELAHPLIGYTTLEILGFKVNPLTRKLEKTYAIEY